MYVPSMSGLHKRETAAEAALRSLMRRFLELSDADQLDFSERVSTALALAGRDRLPADEERARRRDSLKSLLIVRDHLGKRPTTREYEEVAKELGLSWSWQQIQRIWGWSQALDTLESGTRPPSASERSFNRRYSGRNRPRRDEHESLQLWLETKPLSFTAEDYDLWAREVNYRLAEGEMPLPRAGAIGNRLALPWRQIVVAAGGEVSQRVLVDRRQKEADWSRGERLISVATVALMTGRSRAAATNLTNSYGFPVEVATFYGRRAWLFDEVSSYLAGDEVPRHPPNRLQAEYLERKEFFSMIGFSPRERRPSVDVEPYGMVGGARYWSRREVERWVERNQARIAKRRARVAGTTRAADGQAEFVTSGQIAKHLNVTQDAVHLLVATDGFPEPVFRTAHIPVWHWPQVEAHLAQQPIPEAPLALDELLIDRLELRDLLALGINRAFSTKGVVPPVYLKAASKHLWHRDRVLAWARSEPERLAEINERRARRNMPPLEGRLGVASD
jgi:predicted DNA-binding transcriptional regulator AlpA